MWRFPEGSPGGSPGRSSEGSPETRGPRPFAGLGLFGLFSRVFFPYNACNGEAQGSARHMAGAFLGIHTRVRWPACLQTGPQGLHTHPRARWPACSHTGHHGPHSHTSRSGNERWTSRESRARSGTGFRRSIQPTDCAQGARGQCLLRGAALQRAARTHQGAQPQGHHLYRRPGLGAG